ncbi:MAG TPA: hypothetical protein VK474_09740 [Chthoniobacterales bacterium]|nr:hypothetical protein [Chthoniobacterales bacterium]
MDRTLFFYHLRPALALGAIVTFACASCDQAGDTKITVYRAPKEPQPASSPASAAADGAAATGVHWSAPAGWEEKPASGFRKGSFLVRSSDGKSADVSIISFPEAAGGVLANVNRWREQLKLPPITNETEAGTPLPANGHDILFVDVASAEAITPDGSKSRILGGILSLPGETWFFKMMGADGLVAAQRDAFKQFLQSVHLDSAAETHAPMKTNAGGSTNEPTPPLLETTGGPPLQFTLPPGWKEKPLTPMRVASFNVSAANGKEVDVSVVSLAGMAGGNLANVNRWRDQVKLPPIDESALQQAAEHVNANGHDYLLVDLASAGPVGEKNEKQRILAAILDGGERAWFIKMIGEDEAVASQKDGFIDFLRSLKIPE